jgi:hypothetical protein
MTEEEEQRRESREEIVGTYGAIPKICNRGLRRGV